MNTSRFLFIPVCFAIIPAGSCHRSSPEAYGIYADTDHGRLSLQGQTVSIVGNVLNPVAGIAGPSGAECSSLKQFIVYEKDVPPTAIGLVRLDFAFGKQIPGFVGSTRVDVKLWLPTEVVEVEIKPIEERRDMYLIAPKKELGKGFYALYIGSFGALFESQKRVYDITVGAAKEFPSYQAQLEQLKSTAATLIAKTNRVLNAKSYEQLGDVYRPDGKLLAGEDLLQFVKGSQTWLSSAGKILKSEVAAVAPSAGGDSIQCSVTTTYEKIGAQQEMVTVKKLDGQYFITQIR